VTALHIYFIEEWILLTVFRSGGQFNIYYCSEAHGVIEASDVNRVFSECRYVEASVCM